MAEEVKNIRLSKFAKEFNVGLPSLVECLGKNGYQVDLNPNTRLTPEQYDLLAETFKDQRVVKEQADKIAEMTAIVNAADKKAEEATAGDYVPDEVIIKNVYSKPAASASKAEAQSDNHVAEEKKVVEEQPAAEVEKVEQPVAEKKEEEPVAEAKPVAEKPAKKAKPAGDAATVGVNVVGKIDLDDVDGSTRPQRKKESKKKNEKSESRHEKAAKPAPVEAPAPKDEPQPEVEAVAQPEPKKEVEFIETQYTKLEGPKVVSKIDLTQFEKPKPAESEKKKKRNRIKKEGIKVDDVAGSMNNKNANGGANGGNQGKKDKDKANKKGNKNAPKKVEIDDSEIEKQIRDTLARLGTMGKSKTSKHNREKRQKVQMRTEEERMNELENQKTLQVTEFVTANELATMMNVPVTQIISTCMAVGRFVSINQRLDAETISFIADEFGFQINFASADVVDTLQREEEEDRPEDMVPRTPIITVMGHVDHGKTSLLDYIRKTNVIAGEAGGITQHIGAYEVTMPDGRKITFLDTPGHEAFTAMRARGAKMTDIAIIVISADDHIMPQTVEAINHAQAAGVPIIFAINKIDKPGADPDRIKTELANMNLLVEEWGGKYQSQDISAKKGINVDELLEKVLLQAEIMELKGNPNKRAKGTVIESSLDKGRGYVAKLLVEDGTIRKGDPIVAGSISGRVRAMYNERNQEVMSAGPSQPVLLLGLTGACQAGDTFNVMPSEKEAKDIAAKRTQLQREMGLRTQTHVTLDEIGRRIALGNFKELNVIVKGDVDGSVEALSDSLIKLSTEEVQVNVIHKAVGQITESDVLLAESSDAIIIGFQVRPSVGARKMAETQQIDIRLYSIIYDAINELKDAIEGMLAPETQEKIVANLEIRETFKISKVGTIAGCMCLDGKIQRSHNVRIIRDGIVVYTGKLASLKRFKDDVKEVVAGQDCGLNIENFNDIKIGDIVEAYEIIEVKRKL
ncbi:MAG: translation initiation factor IF-2 [Bacteroidales bacterium]|nr:translation initiation factor IF-2 [Bacteroidales bacterium]